MESGKLVQLVYLLSSVMAGPFSPCQSLPIWRFEAGLIVVAGHAVFGVVGKESLLPLYNFGARSVLFGRNQYQLLACDVGNDVWL